MTPEVSIILVNYNATQLTCDCIASIYKQVQSCTPEIIVVDNASSTPIQAIRELYPEVMVIELEKNVGFGSANNIGAKRATGEYVFFLNTDTILNNDPFPFFITHMKENPEVGITGTYLKDAEGKYIRSGGHPYSMRKYIRLALNRYIHRPTKPEVTYGSTSERVGYVLGADIFMRREAFMLSGGFDERIFMYFEDVELCRRMQQQLHMQCHLISGPDITHLEGGSTTSSFSRVHNTASMIYCFKKEFPALQVLGFQIVYFVLKLPVIFDKRYSFAEHKEYLGSIFNYKKHLNKI